MTVAGVRPTFAPVGEKARWRIVYDLLQRKDYDQVLTFEAMAEALNLSAHGQAHRSLIIQAVQRAGRELSVRNSRSIENVRGVGYRVVEPEEHVRLAGKGQQKAHRTLKVAQRHVEHVDYSKLSDEGKTLVIAALRVFKIQERGMRDLKIRQRQTAELVERVEQAGRQTAERVDEHEGRVQEQDERIKALEERLARLAGGGQAISAPPES